MDSLERIALDRLGVLAVPAGQATPSTVTAALAELAHMGVRVANPVAANDALAAKVGDVARHLRVRRGQRGTYTPLFPGFPDQLPAVDDIGLRVMLAAARLAGVDAPDEADVRAALDFTGIGWWPASSVPQDVEQTLLDRAYQAALPTDGRVEWQTLRLIGPADLEPTLREYMSDCFAAATSLREDVRADLAELVSALGVAHIDPGTVRFRETRTLLARATWDTDRGALPTLGLTPDDLLRLFADLTDTDTSLATAVRYPRLTRADRRLVVACLEGSDRLADVFRRRDLWLAIGRGLHVGEHDAPRTNEVFARLRTTRHDHTALTSRFERALTDDYAAAVDLLAVEAPGLLVRSLRRLAALAGADSSRVTALLTALGKASSSVPLRVLLAARNQVADNGATYPRVAITKGGAAVPILRAPGHLEVPGEIRARLLAHLGHAVDTQLAAKGSWRGERVHVAPGLDRVLVPEALRTTAAGLAQVERGSVLPASDAKVLRLFVHWKDASTDLDLSCLALGEGFDLVDHVSWTNLTNRAMVHSGDITSAPAGAQEFIDVNLAKAREQGSARGWRYLAPAVFRYSGRTFDALEEAVAGWMLRDDVSTAKVAFDPATVANAFELTGGKRVAVPFLLDLVTGEFVYVDVYLGGLPYAMVERDGGGIGFLARAIVARRSLKTDVASLVTSHAAARGAVLVDDPADATITVGLGEGCTYNALRPERLLADLL